MFLERIIIKQYRVFKDIGVRFQTVEDSPNGNIVFVVAGINGTGKTSLLEAIYNTMSASRVQHHDIEIEAQLRTNYGRVGTSQQGAWDEIKKAHKGAKLIFLPSQQSFEYFEESKIEKSDRFAQKISSQSLIGRAEYYIKEFVLTHERTSNVADPSERTRQAVNAFNEIFADANLLTKLSDLSSKLFNRPIFENAVGKKVTIDQLSDGEKQLYGRLIALMILDPHDSLILIDEPEIALHPAWQQIIMKLYSNIGTNNQFIVATHSPQVIASVPYQNRIILHKENGKIVPIHCSQPPSGVDVNSILSEVMGAEPRDPELSNLYNQYRSFVEKGEEKSLEAESLKKKIGKRESAHSEFMEEMQFIIELRDA